MGPFQPGGGVGLWRWPRSQDAHGPRGNRKQEASHRAGRGLGGELAPACRACWLASSHGPQRGQHHVGLVAAGPKAEAHVWVQVSGWEEEASSYSPAPRTLRVTSEGV